MDRQQYIRAMLVSIAIFMIWMIVAPKIFPDKTPTTQPADSGTTRPATQVATSRPADVSAGPEAPAAPSDGDLVVKAAVTEQTCEIGSIAPEGPYPMRLELTNRGAAVKAAQLRNFKRELGKPDPYPLLTPVQDPVGQRAFYSLATEKLRIETYKQDVPLEELLWTFDRVASNDGTAVYRARIVHAGKDVLEVTKTFQIAQVGAMPKRGQEKLEDRRHDLSIMYGLANLSGEPLSVRLVQIGPMGMHNEDPRSDWRKVVAGTRTGKEILVEGNGKPGRGDVLKKESHAIELTRDEAQKQLAWLSLANKYFACIVRPDRQAGSPLGIDKSEAVTVTRSTDAAFGEDLTFRLVTAPITVEPGKAAEARFACYMGPKSKVAFEQLAEYRDQNYFQVIQADFYCCAPAPIVRIMMWLLHILYLPTRNYGIAIILLVVIVRLTLHPITKLGQVNMMQMQKKMGKLQPKIEEIKKKYANDRQKLNEATMEVYRESGVNPASQSLTCLPMFLQMPIWAGLWAALSSTIEMRHAPFDGFWIKDLSGPDALISFGAAYDVPLLSLLTGPISAINVLPILLTITMYLQQKLMPKAAPPPTSSQSQDQFAQQQKMMNFMTIFFGFMFYNMPSGLNLYIMASNIGGIFEQKRIRKHVEELQKREETSPAKKREKPKWIAWVEKQVEDARKVKTPKK